MSAGETLRVWPGAALHGAVTPPGDKSLSHRAVVLAALAQGVSQVDNLLIAGVTRPMLDTLTALRVPWRLDGARLTVDSPGPAGWHPPSRSIHCGHSATTMRLLAGALAAAGVPAVLDGSPGLRRRPMRRVTEPLRRMGVPITDTDGHAPLTLAARDPSRSLRGGTFSLPVASAQVKSAILLAGLAAAEPITVREPGPSRDHTERLLHGLGLRVEPPARHTVTLHPRSVPLPPLHLRLPGDISAAAFLLVAALITPGSRVVLERVGLNPTRTGLLDVFHRMGANLTVQPQGEIYGEPYGRIVARYSPRLRGVSVEGGLVVRMIDEFPVFAVAAAYAQGPTTVRGAAELRHKESDRIAALVSELRALGVAVDEHPDGFTVHGGRGVRGGTVRAYRDHRLAMALAVAGLAAREPVQVQGAAIFRESYPDFVAHLRALGAHLTWVPRAPDGEVAA